MALLHGGWDTIILALGYWAVIFAGPPLVLVLVIVWFVRRRRARQDAEPENLPD